MAIIARIGLNDPLSLVVIAVLLILTYNVSNAIYFIFFHPLASVPGPLTWKITRLRYLYSLVTGNLVNDTKKLHAIYGDVVRLAPDEVAYAKEAAWMDIFTVKDGRKYMGRSPAFSRAPPPQPENLATTTQIEDNQRMRKLMAPAFTESALKEQEPIIRGYVELLVKRLVDIAKDGEKNGAVVDIMSWLNFAAFDIISDLSFGESFGSLQNSQYHWWVAVVFKFIKGMALSAAAGFYPMLDYILLKMVPRHIRKMQAEHYDLAVKKVRRRMTMEKSRNDFMAPVIANNPNFQYMSRDEVESTFSMLIVTGSETTGTTLAGIFNFLANSPRTLAILTKEIRDTFKEKSEITFASVRDLEYLNAVIYEGLRICNPVPLGIPRVVPDGGGYVCGQFLPAGTKVSISSTAFARSEKHFYRCDEYIPERWLPSGKRPIEFENDSRSSQKPFYLGPRTCPGRSLAWAEMRSIIAHLVFSLDIEAPPEGMLDWFSLKSYIVVQKKPVNIRIKSRELMEG